MTVSGELLIGSTSKIGEAPPFQAFDPATGAHIEPDFRGASIDDLERVCALADAAFESYRAISPEDRARFLEAIAQNLLDVGEVLVARGMRETGLPQARLNGELGRTVGQLRLFAGELRDGGYLDVRIDPALPDRAPPRADLRLMYVPLGPVVVFGASNFPLAFSVAGGDTASALAAGCPVIVKAHSAHPGTSEIAGKAVQKAVADCGLHEGVFSMLFDSSRKIGTGLVADARIQAVGFTGSRAGGLALVKIAQERKQPIPVYAEMSSINPVILLPGALAERGEAIGKAFAAALTLGSGQFCTNPGLVLALAGSETAGFVQGASAALGTISPAPMLTQGIHKAYVSAVADIAAKPSVETLARGAEAEGFAGQAGLFATTAEHFQADHSLREEMFGASSLMVRCQDIEALIATIDDLEGQLTIAVHATEADLPIARRLLSHLEKKAGRILFNGFGTGVEVSHAMVHGGPFPSTSDVRTTSVGSLAIMRFLRPVCYQDVPSALLPEAVADGNPLSIPRRVNGTLELGK